MIDFDSGIFDHATRHNSKSICKRVEFNCALHHTQDYTTTNPAVQYFICDLAVHYFRSASKEEIKLRRFKKFI